MRAAGGAGNMGNSLTTFTETETDSGMSKEGERDEG